MIDRRAIPPHLLTPAERERGVRMLHELSHERQVEVKPQMAEAIRADVRAALEAERESLFGMAVG